MRRREFIKSSALSGGALLIGSGEAAAHGAAPIGPDNSVAPKPANPLPDLSPARWIWYPSTRTLQNTFLLFRRELHLAGKPRSARGWITADSRYRVEVNGHRIQWGPAPCDPRWLDADPIDLTEALTAGDNVLGATVLFYGAGDGTSPVGKPGFLFWLELESEDGAKQTIVSDGDWRVHLARAWQPGRYKRFYTRSLQEIFDARLHPHGWTTPGFEVNENWLPPLALECAANKPPICSTYNDYLFDTDRSAITPDAGLRARTIPQMNEVEVPVKGLAESMSIEWQRPVEEYFDVASLDAFRPVREAAAKEVAPRGWEVQLDGKRGAALTFEFTDEMVGWPYFTIEAPAGTTVELMVQEAHEVGGPALLNTHWHSWSRFVCREGVNRFEEFDFEAARWVQLHIHGAAGRVVVRDVGMRHRIFPWPNAPLVRFNEPALDRLMSAGINTLNNSTLDTMMDGVARERQQYTGDSSHQLHAIYHSFGERRLPARFVTTISQGITQDGYFLDCWPAYDRYQRIAEREIGISKWGPILDSGVQFPFDCYYYHLYTGDLETLRGPYRALLRFAQYLSMIVGRDGLLPVENLGLPTVYIDWISRGAYEKQSHKQCAFNLYAAAMFQHALAPLCRAMGDKAQAESIAALGAKLQAATVRTFWDPTKKLLIINRPWLATENHIRMCDRSTATAILFDQIPGGDVSASVKALAEYPPGMGMCYPCNQGWRLWALAKAGRADVVVKDLRERWATLPSVQLNNTLQEFWHLRPDSTDGDWSHSCLVPLYIPYMSLAGIRPLAPGFAQCEIRPQLADLNFLELTSFTVKGPLSFRAQGPLGDREVTISLPKGCSGELVVPRAEKLDLEPVPASGSQELRRYRLPQSATFKLVTV